MLISFIIPAYNASNTLQKCIESIMCQNISLSDYEVIVVNDGSEDNTLEILHNIKAKLNNLLIINQNNKGVSAARNAGIKAAIGKYLLFVDADDYLTNNTFIKIIDTAENLNLEVVGFTYNRIKGGETRTIRNGINNRILNGIEWSSKYLGESKYCFRFLINRYFLISNDVYFKDNITVGEDYLFITKLLCLTKYIYYLDLPAYNYVYYKTSLSNKRSMMNLVNRISIIYDLTKYSMNDKLSYAQRKYIFNRLKYIFISFIDSVTRYIFSKQLMKLKSSKICFISQF